MIDTYLKDNWKELYYNPELQTVFSLFRSAKKSISKGNTSVETSHGKIDVYAIDKQLLFIQTYSLVYRAKISAQLGQSTEIE